MKSLKTKLSQEEKKSKYHETEKKKSPLLLNEVSGDPWREHRVRDTSVPTPGVNMAVESQRIE